MPLSLSQSLLALNNNRLSLFTVHSSLFTIYALSLLYTKSQTGIIAAFVSLGLYALTLLFTKSFPKLLTLPFTLLILLFCLTPNPLFSRIIPKSSPSTNNRQQPTTLNITPSENIRQIVWQGAWQLAQKYPLFGTGTETFAYSYYWTRPALHNLTSEWDFLYNKAHNEYLNLAATTGLFGLTSYLFLILSSLFFILKHLISDHQSPITDHLNPALLAGFISILITNFTGFSVVVIGLFLFLLPLLATSAPIPTTPTSPPTSSFRYVLAALILFFGFKSLITVVNHYSADYFFAQAEKFENRSNLTPALQSIQLSLQLKPQEPIYLIRAASITAKQAASLAQENKNSPNLPNLTNSVLNLTHQALSISPANTNLWKEQAQIFYYLSAVDLNYYLQAIDSLHKVVLLAPTDAKTYFTLGRFYQSLNRLDEAIKYYRLALDLKSNYDHASFALGEIYYTQKNYPQAQSYFEQTLKTAPANTSAQSYLEKINSYTSDP
jgi:Flp pilus assembly protein TadD